MARVVSQRSGPPYLLVVFVILFLISTAVAIWKSVGEDKANKTVDSLSKNFQKITGRAQPKDLSADLQAMIDQTAKGSVIQQFQERIKDLTLYLSGDEKTAYDLVATDANAAFSKYGKSGVLFAVSTAYEKLGEAQKTTEEKDAQNQALQADRDAKDKALTALTKEVNDKVQDYEGKVKALETKVAEGLKDFEHQKAVLADAKAKELAELNKALDEKDKEIIRTREELVKLQTKGITKPGGVPMPSEPNAAEGAAVRLASNGTVLKVADTLCYVDLGANAHVQPGLTFAVHGRAGGVLEDKAKAQLVVTVAHDLFSECRIVNRSKDNPILRGDALVNIAFSPGRTYRFVVVGLFDFTGSGKASLQGAEEVRALVRRFGGVVVNEVSSDADYVVKGEPPPAPAEGSDDDPPQVKAAREEAERATKTFQEAAEAARKNNIPVMNLNRFLELTGYDLQKTNR